MKIEFSDHAELKIRQRKLPRQKILATVLQPDFIQLGYNEREKLFKKFNRNHLQAVIKREPSRIIVITAHWIAKAPKK